MSPLVLISMLGALDAPITQVTVFTDQARVIRSAQVRVSGTQTIEWPALRESVDVSSIRVEAQGAEVRRVDIERLEPAALRTQEAKALLSELENVTGELGRLSSEHAVLTEHQTAIERLSPTAPTSEAHTPIPKLTAAGWSAASQFATDQLARVQKRRRETEAQQRKLTELRAALNERARLLGSPEFTSGWRVTATLAGSGSAALTLSYVVRQARWAPTWDLQLLPETSAVTLSLAGLVSQDSGEDWVNAAVTLSTAVPFSAVKVPKLTTWKIGTTDRFIPTATPLTESISPPPKVPRLQATLSEEDRSYYSLQSLTDESDEAPPPPTKRTSLQSFESLAAQIEARPQAAPQTQAVFRKTTQHDFEESVVEANLVKPEGSYVASKPTQSASLSPPRAWRAPTYPPDSPAALAGGAALTFNSLQRESVPSAKGARRVALWSERWPVTVERKLYPALSSEAYLVAELKNPSQQVLPGGPAQLYVGADPAGTASLKLVSPGEAFTLPLGIDRAVKSVRNIQVIDSTVGLISKEELSTYSVSIEVANPYRAPITLRVYDQWPLSTQKEVETKLLDSKPGAIQDLPNGALEWRLTLASQQKQTLSFTYSVKRPQGWKLSQSEVTR